MESFFDFMIVAVIFITIFGGGIFKSILRHRKEIRALEVTAQSSTNKDEHAKLKNEVNDLKARIEVLEKSVTDNKYQLEKEIASL